MKQTYCEIQVMHPGQKPEYSIVKITYQETSDAENDLRICNESCEKKITELRALRKALQTECENYEAMLASSDDEKQILEVVDKVINATQEMAHMEQVIEAIEKRIADNAKAMRTKNHLDQNEQDAQYAMLLAKQWDAQSKQVHMDAEIAKSLMTE